MKIEPLAHVPATTPGTPRRYFIADLHLDGTNTPRAQNFRRFLKRLEGEAAAVPVELYILGDLFEFWYEYRAALFELYRDDLNALESAARAGVQIFLLSGNRDFAYGQYTYRRFGAIRLGDGGSIVLGDSRPAWLEHGDLLCTADKRYQRFRRIVRSWPVKVFFWLMPWSFARGIIDNIKEKTRRDKQAKSIHDQDIDLDAARARLEREKCRVLLCGHIHRARTEDLGAGFRLLVLPPWCDTPAGYVDDRGTLTPFSLDD